MRKVKRVAAVLLVAVMMGGCGNSGVSQDEYDKAVAERDELKIENENIGKLLEINKKSSEYKAKIEAEYEHALFVFYVSGKISNADMDEQKKSVLELKETAISALNGTADTYSTLNSLKEINEDSYNATMQTIENINGEWEETYNMVVNIEKMFMGN